MLDWVETDPAVAMHLFGKSQSEMAKVKGKQTRPFKKPSELTAAAAARQDVGMEEDSAEEDETFEMDIDENY